jgi:hypothetical protein
MISNTPYILECTNFKFLGYGTPSPIGPASTGHHPPCSPSLRLANRAACFISGFLCAPSQRLSSCAFLHVSGFLHASCQPWFQRLSSYALSSSSSGLRLADRAACSISGAHSLSPLAYPAGSPCSRSNSPSLTPTSLAILARPSGVAAPANRRPASSPLPLAMQQSFFLTRLLQ